MLLSKYEELELVDEESMELEFEDAVDLELSELMLDNEEDRLEEELDDFELLEFEDDEFELDDVLIDDSEELELVSSIVELELMLLDEERDWLESEFPVNEELEEKSPTS